MSATESVKLGVGGKFVMAKKAANRGNLTTDVTPNLLSVT